MCVAEHSRPGRLREVFGSWAICHCLQANQLWALLAVLTHALMINRRRLGSQDTQACIATKRTKLPKIGPAVLRNPGQARFLLTSAHR